MPSLQTGFWSEFSQKEKLSWKTDLNYNTLIKSQKKVLLGQRSGGSGKHLLLPRSRCPLLAIQLACWLHQTGHGHKNLKYFYLLWNFGAPTKPEVSWGLCITIQKGLKPPTQNTTGQCGSWLCQNGRLLQWIALGNSIRLQ